MYHFIKATYPSHFKIVFMQNRLIFRGPRVDSDLSPSVLHGFEAGLPCRARPFLLLLKATAARFRLLLEVL